MKNNNNFFNMHSDVHYYAAKLKLKFNLYMEKQKKQIVLQVKWTKFKALFRLWQYLKGVN